MCTVENESEKWLRNFLGFLTFFVSLFGLVFLKIIVDIGWSEFFKLSIFKINTLT